MSASNATVAAVFTDVANAIRTKDGTTAKIQPINYADRITALSCVGTYSLSVKAHDGGVDKTIQAINTNSSNTTTFGIYTTDVWLGSGLSDFVTADAYLIDDNSKTQISMPEIGRSWSIPRTSVLTVWNSTPSAEMFYLNNVYYELNCFSGTHSGWVACKRSFLLSKDSTLLCNGYVRSCLCKGTKIRLADGSFKNIENISYEDTLLAWDFDDGKQSSARPVLISPAKQSYSEYNLLTLESGIVLETIYNHSWFNITKGKFTRCVEGTDIGDEILTLDGPKKLLSKEIIKKEKEYYTIITDHCINCYANNILTGNAFCNLYPIEDMKYQKTKRVENDFALFAPYIDKKIWEAYRASEAPFDHDYMMRYLTKEAAHFNLSKYDAKLGG